MIRCTLPEHGSNPLLLLLLPPASFASPSAQTEDVTLPFSPCLPLQRRRGIIITFDLRLPHRPLFINFTRVSRRFEIAARLYRDFSRCSLEVTRGGWFIYIFRIKVDGWEDVRCCWYFNTMYVMCINRMFIVNDYLKSFTQIILDESETMILSFCPFFYFKLVNKLKKRKGIIFVVERSISQEGASS